ncbi:MAG TPA: hypothetical protein VFA60_11375 [Terriglobales bacterium]|nr:hypothetical protein [Terriglobales bacterium]
MAIDERFVELPLPLSQVEDFLFGRVLQGRRVSLPALADVQKDRSEKAHMFRLWQDQMEKLAELGFHLGLADVPARRNAAAVLTSVERILALGMAG